MTSDEMSVFLDELDELMKRHNVTGSGFFMHQPGGEPGDVRNIGRITDPEQLYRAQFGFSMLKSQMWEQLGELSPQVKKPYAKIPGKVAEKGVIGLEGLTDMELGVWGKLLKDAEWEGEIKYD